jgi:hypothetical protein
MSLARARQIADAVLYEGYVLFPYRASSRKNRYRWTFGVVAPRAWNEAGGCEPSSLRLECLVASAGPPPAIEGLLRFLQVERRDVEAAHLGGRFAAVERLIVADREHIRWEEGVAHELPFAVAVAGEATRPLGMAVAGGRREELLHEDGALVGRVVRARRALALTLTATTQPLSATLAKLTLTVENVTAFDRPAAPREDAVAAALVGAHLILSVTGGAFVSLLDPPAAVRDAAAACVSSGLYPVLVGEPGSHELLLAAPIALYDHPAIAAESPGESCDGTEIDELLALSTRSLTDAEKREACATDSRAAEIVARADRLAAAELLALHGRTSQPAAGGIMRGSRVRIRLAAPAGARRSDAQDMFLDGRIGVVEEVREDYDGQTHLAVILDDDPGADLHRWYGRHWHFRPDELELVEMAP